MLFTDMLNDVRVDPLVNTDQRISAQHRGNAQAAIQDEKLCNRLIEMYDVDSLVRHSHRGRRRTCCIQPPDLVGRGPNSDRSLCGFVWLIAVGMALPKTVNTSESSTSKIIEERTPPESQAA